MLVEDFEDDAVDDYRLEYLGYVEAQRVAPFAWGVQEADGGVELRLVHCPQRLGIAHHVAKRDEGVHLVFGRLFCALAHVVVVENDAEGRVIGLADVALNAHDFVYSLSPVKALGQLPDGVDCGLQVFAAAVVVAQVHHHVPRRALNEFPGQRHAFPLILAGGRLSQQGAAREQAVAGHKAARVVLVVVKEMHRHSFLAQKVIERAVGAQAAEGIQLCHVFDGDVAWGLAHFVVGLVERNGGKLQRVVLALHYARIE